MTCQSCADVIQRALLASEGIKSVEINVPNETVVVESVLPTEEVRRIIETTGRRAVVKGMGYGKKFNKIGKHKFQPV